VQCKKHKNAVGAGAIRDFVGALSISRLPKGFFVTTSRFTEPAQKEANEAPCELELVTGETLAKWHNQTKNLVNTDLIDTEWWRAFSYSQKAILLILGTICIGVIVGGMTYILLTEYR
ncbi:restriction endonuclease, partial [Chloroflexota bacterium]